MRYSHRTARDKKPFVMKAVLVLLILLVAGGVWVWIVKFESEKPAVSLAGKAVSSGPC